MDKNIILLHLESVNNIIYRMNPQLFPNIMRIEREGLSFHKYFSTATSTWMAVSDMLYGGLDQYEGCRALEERPEAFRYRSSLLDDFYGRGYRVGAFAYPCFELPQMRGHLLFGRNVEQGAYASYGDFFHAVRAAMSGGGKYCIFVANTLSNVAEGRHAAPGCRRTGAKRWEDGYRCIDGTVGSVFQALKESGREEDTVVLLYGDHGDDFWGHGFHAGLTHAIEPIAPLIHTPLIVWEKGGRCGEASGSLISTADIRGMVGRMVRGESPEAGLGRGFAYSRNAFAAQPVREGSFSKGYSVTDGKTLLLVSPRGLEMYDIEMDPACNFNMLSMFDMEQGMIAFNEESAAGLRFHFSDFMDENQKRHIRQKFYRLRPRLYRYVMERYEAGGRGGDEMEREMRFGRINCGMRQFQCFQCREPS